MMYQPNFPTYAPQPQFMPQQMPSPMNRAPPQVAAPVTPKKGIKISDPTTKEALNVKALVDAASPALATKPAEEKTETPQKPAEKTETPHKPVTVSAAEATPTKVEEVATRLEKVDLGAAAPAVKEPVAEKPAAAVPAKAEVAAAPAEKAAPSETEKAKVEGQPAAAADAKAEPARAQPLRVETKSPVLNSSTEVPSDTTLLDGSETPLNEGEASGQQTPLPIARLMSQGITVTNGVKVIQRDLLLQYKVYSDLPEHFKLPSEVCSKNALNSITERVVSRSGPSGNARPSRDRDNRGKKPRGNLSRKQSQAGSAPETPLGPPLVASENAYKRFAVTEDNLDEATLRSIRALLNKLSQENFDALKAEMFAMPIRSQQLLHDIVELFFEKAVDEPLFGPTYAKFCHAIHKEIPGEYATMTPEGEEKSERIGDLFRRALLTKCEISFTNKEHRAEVLTPEMKAEMTPEQLEEYDYNRLRMKRQMLGIMTFIGELYKERLLKGHIMHACLRMLLEDPDEQDLECVCNLLRTVGRQLDTSEPSDKAQKGVKEHIARLQAILAGEKKPSSRIRFMVEGIIELREKDRWIPRDTKVKSLESRSNTNDSSLRSQSRGGGSSRQSTDRGSRGGRGAPPAEAAGTYRPLGMKPQASQQTFQPGWKRSTSSQGPQQVATPAPVATKPNKFDALRDDSGSNAAPAQAAEAKPATPPPKKGNPEEVERRTGALISGYLNNKDLAVRFFFG